MLKKLFPVLFVLITFLITFLSCEEPVIEEEQQVVLTGSYLKINESVHRINNALLENFGEVDSQGIYEIHLSIYSDIVATGKNGKVSEISGIGNVLFLKIFTSYTDSIDAGKYNLNNSNNKGTFRDAQYFLNWDTTDKTSRWTHIINGSVNVIKEDDSYIINLTGIDEKGNSIEAAYIGYVKHFN